jgi:hypothetical protein
MNSPPSPFDSVPMTDDGSDVARATLALARVPANWQELSKPELAALIVEFAEIYTRLSQELVHKEQLLAKQSKGE